MRYYVNLDSDPASPPIAVDVVELPSRELEVKVGANAVSVDVLALRDQLSVSVGGQIVDLTIDGALPDIGAIAAGLRGTVRVESERMRLQQRAQRGAVAGGAQVVKSPMPGRVIRVLVSRGDRVQVGQPILVIEAMKMENEVRAKTECVVAEVHVAVGATVEGNAKLVTLA